VFRPIPHTIFGRTCLKAPESDNPNASFHFITREYTVHLFGLELKFESLAFQEQDNAVSACATAALWFMFQCTCKWINHPILSPYEITLKAKEIISSEPRKNMKDFRGLSIPQMVHVIKQLNIEPFILQPSNNQNYFKAQIYAYLKGKIPIIVGARLNGDDKDNLENHAMTLTGYGINTENSRNFFNDNEKTGLDCINMYSSLVDRLFVHDDQLGPFGDLLFSKNDCFRTSLTDIGHFNKKYASINANVFALIYPLLPKIRIDFDEIFGIIREFQRMSLHNALIYGNPANVIAWDLYLSSVCDLKAHFSQDTCIEAKVKLNLLTKSFPRHIWVIDAVQLDETGNKEVLFSLYFDATDISNGNLFICSLHRTSKSVESIKDSISHCKPENHHVRQILQAYDQKKNTSQIFTSTSIA
jgi:hypothetical protein